MLVANRGLSYDYILGKLSRADFAKFVDSSEDGKSGVLGDVTIINTSCTPGRDYLDLLVGSLQGKSYWRPWSHSYPFVLKLRAC